MSWVSLVRVLPVVLAACLFVGCGVNRSPLEIPCTRGESRQCQCGALLGAEVCEGSGSWGTCSCGVGGTGGISGTGGVSGTGGISGTGGTGGISGTGGVSGTGGISGTGGVSGTGGANGCPADHYCGTIVILNLCVQNATGLPMPCVNGVCPVGGACGDINGTQVCTTFCTP
jgi:hypothetical protein